MVLTGQRSALLVALAVVLCLAGDALLVVGGLMLLGPDQPAAGIAAAVAGLALLAAAGWTVAFAHRPWWILLVLSAVVTVVPIALQLGELGGLEAVLSAGMFFRFGILVSVQLVPMTIGYLLPFHPR